jgi:hypothetical protein
MGWASQWVGRDHPPIHNSWDIEKTHQLRTRDAKQIAQLSGFFEAAQREIPDDQSFF